MPANTITMAEFGLLRPVPKRAFAFRYIESMGQKWLSVRLPDEKNRLSRVVGKSNFRGLLINLQYSQGKADTPLF